jgi:hypothetical protein
MQDIALDGPFGIEAPSLTREAVGSLVVHGTAMAIVADAAYMAISALYQVSEVASSKLGTLGGVFGFQGMAAGAFAGLVLGGIAKGTEHLAARIRSRHIIDRLNPSTEVRALNRELDRATSRGAPGMSGPGLAAIHLGQGAEYAWVVRRAETGETRIMSPAEFAAFRREVDATDVPLVTVDFHDLAAECGETIFRRTVRGKLEGTNAATPAIMRIVRSQDGDEVTARWFSEGIDVSDTVRRRVRPDREVAPHPAP